MTRRLLRTPALLASLLFVTLTGTLLLSCSGGGGGGGGTAASTDAEIGRGVEGSAPIIGGGPAVQDFAPPSQAIIVPGVPWINQTTEAADPNWTRTKTCGPASSAMLARFHTGRSVTIKEVSDYISSNFSAYSGWNNGDGGYTTFDQNKAYLASIGLTVTTISGADYRTLETELTAGRPVFIWHETQGDNNTGDMRSGAPHFMLITGISQTDIVVHDPGRSTNTQGEYRHYSLSSFLSIWGRHSHSALLVSRGAGSLAVPSGLMVSSQTSASMALSWSSVGGATTYDLERALSPSGPWTQPYSGSGTSHNDTGLSGSTTYSYRVRATNSGGSSNWSSPVSGTTDPSVSTTTPLTGLTRPASIVLKGTNTAYFTKRTDPDGQIIKWDIPSNTTTVVVTGLKLPTSLALDGDTLYVADWGNYLVKSVDTSQVSHPVTIFAGNGLFNYTGGSSPTGTGMQPKAVAIDLTTHDVYIAELGFSRLLKVTSSNVLSEFAGNGSIGDTGDGGAATSASLRFPDNMHLVGGNLIFKNANYLRKINLLTAIIDIQPLTLPGGGTATFDGEFTPDGAGGLFLVQQSENKVFRVALPSGQMTLLAGTGTAGAADGPPLTATFTNPFSLANRGTEALVCETDAGRIRSVPH